MTETLIANHNNHAVIVPAKVVTLPEKKQVEDVEPPDGGGRAYLVMFSAFLCNGILFGIINTYSVIYLSLQRQLKESGVENASSSACKSITRVLSRKTRPRRVTRPNSICGSSTKRETQQQTACG